MHLKDLAGLRQMAYGLFSSILLYPEEKRLRAITAAAADLREQSAATFEFAFADRWQRFLASLADPSDYRALGEEYVRVFMHNPAGVPCLPYESVYVDPSGRAAGWIVALLEQEYASAGLALSPSLSDLPDHVAVELEFMAFLCGQEAHAWNREVISEGIQSLERQASFLGRHLARWLPEWARQVATVNGEGIYSVVAETAQDFITHDQDLVNVLLHRLRRMLEAGQVRAVGKAVIEKQQCVGSPRHGE